MDGLIIINKSLHIPTYKYATTAEGKQEKYFVLHLFQKSQNKFKLTFPMKLHIFSLKIN